MKKKLIIKNSLSNFFNNLIIVFYSLMDKHNFLKIQKNTKKNIDYEIFKL